MTLNPFHALKSKWLHALPGMRLSLVLRGGIFMVMLFSGHLNAGPYAPVAGQPGSTALLSTDSLFIDWTSDYEAYEPGEDVDSVWRTPELALGPASAPGQGNVFDIVSLGRGGSITLFFDSPIYDGESYDFAVFENAFSSTFLELAFVEVSSDGVHFFRFPNDSLSDAPIGAFGFVDTTNINGLAGKYSVGYGTPFDLAMVPDDILLDKNKVTHVRIIDVVGGSSRDTSGDIIYDPFPTIGSAGFDLDAIGVIHNQSSNISLTFYLTDEEAESGWLFLPGNIGWANVQYHPWLHHPRLKWVYMAGENLENAWLWMEALGWQWTTVECFPWLWNHDRQTWVYYFWDSSSSKQWFYHAKEQSWFFLPE